MLKNLFNIIFKILAIFSWVQALIGIGTLLIVMFVDDNFTLAHLIIFFIVISLFILIGIAFWLLSNKFKNNNRVLNESPNTRKSEDHSISRISVEITTEPPEEVLTEMKKSYSLMQSEGDIRILSDSVELIKSTKNLETFISRFELAQQKALTLEQALKTGINIPSKFTGYKELNEMKQIYAPKILRESYERVKRDALKLKTDKGRLNRLQKFYVFLEENDIFFEEFEEYNEIINSLKDDIKKYSTSNFGG